MKRTVQILAVITSMLLAKQNIYSQTSPVTVTTICNYPSSLYLPDYYSAGSNKLVANLMLNDYNEPSSDVYLRVTFESQDVKIYTRPDYYPTEPVTLYPGEINPLSGDALAGYLNYNNVVMEGITYTELVSNGGRLPEGYYNICVEAYDLATHTLLSNTSCAIVHLAQYEPPTLVSPTKGTAIQPGAAQNINFTWVNEAPINPGEVNYTFTLHELIDSSADPLTAVQNKQTTIVYQEEGMVTTMFNYNTSHPLLEVGKTYIATVKAESNDGKAMFKNDGLSQSLYFYYGYPGGGKIQLLSPEDQSALTLTKEKTFSWSAPDNLLAGQTYHYLVKIAEVDSTKTYEELLAGDTLLYDLETPVRTGSMDYYKNVNAFFPTGENFVWQVKAFSGDQEIATSAIGLFGGPPCITDFIAADEYITVTYTEGCDKNSLTGTGTVQINGSGETHEVYFKNISIDKEGVQFYLQTGAVYGVFEDPMKIALAPEFERNGNAWFYADTLKLTRNDYRMHGHVEWDFPHAADQDEKPVMKSVPVWLDYADFELLGPAPLIDSLNFDLLDPMNFNVMFTHGSRFYLRGGNHYFMELHGDITLPENVTDQNGEVVKVPFQKHEQVFNFYSDSELDYVPLWVANRTTLTLGLTGFVLDLDDRKSYGHYKSEPAWRGFYINTGQYVFEGDYTFSKQFASNETLSTAYNFNTREQDHAYIQSDGLYVYSDIAFDKNELFFNTFPALLDNFHIEVEASHTTAGAITGGITIPLLNDEENFPFTCNLNRFGFQTGYLNDSLEGKTFVYNEGAGEQELYLTINRGYFADNERLETNINIEWPYTGLTFENLPQFDIWGNYDIGFGAANNGLTLAEQKEVLMKGFEVTFDGIAAGRSANLYSLAFTGTMIMGEDVSGDEGPPDVNIYSIYESQSIDEKYVLTGTSQYVNEDQTSVSGSTGAATEVGEATDEEAVVGDVDALNEKYTNAAAELESGLDAIQPTWSVGEETTTIDLEEEVAELVNTTHTETAETDYVSGLSVEDLKTILVFAKGFIKDTETKAQIEDLISFLDKLTDNELLSLLDKFKDLRSTLNGIIETAITSFVAEHTRFIQEQADKINEKISAPITKGTNKLVEEFNKHIDEAINYLAEGAMTAFSSHPNIAEKVNELSESVRKNLKDEIARVAKQSVQTNIVDYLTGTIDYVMYDGTVEWLSGELAENAAAVLTDKDFQLSDVNIDLEGHIQEMGDELAERFTWDALQYQVKKTFQDTYDNFSWDSIKSAFVDDFAAALISEAVSKVVGDVAGEFAGAAFSGLADNVELDFSNLGDKLKSGDLSGIVKFDPSKIVIRSNPADIDGFVYFFEDDPTWGDCWQAEINALIKIPEEESAFIVLVDYINGNKPKSGQDTESDEPVETFKYWFFELGVMDIEVPFGPIPLSMYGMKGKVYHHMCRQGDNETYYPNDSIRYGAGLRVYMMDQGSKGKMVDFNIGLELELMSGGFVLELNGDGVFSNTPETKQSNAVGDGSHVYKKSIAIAGGYLKYNSVDKHLLGEMSAELQTSPLLCAGGKMIIDVSKEWWQFAIGTRAEPMFISLLCRDTIFKGWFDINKAGLDIGLMAHLGFDLKTPYVNFVVAKVQGWASFHFDFEAELVAYWQPSFGIQKARVYMDLYAGVGINYKTPPLYRKVKKFTIAAVNLGGELEFATTPDAYLKGGMHGSVTVLNCSVGMSFDAEINL